MPPSVNHTNKFYIIQTLRLFLLFIWIAIIFWLSLAPSPPRLGGLLGWDKLQHGLAYGLLAWLLSWVLVYRRSGFNRQAWWQSWLLTCLFGGILEILQMMMHNGRTAEWGDLLADATGALISCVIFRQVWVFGKLKSRQNVENDG